MMLIHGEITTRHRNAACVAAALRPDNLNSLTTIAEGDHVTTTITGTQIRTVIASADDYLMNLTIAEDACSVNAQDSEFVVRRPEDRQPGKSRCLKKNTGE